MNLKRSLLAVDLSIISAAVTDKAKIPGLDAIWFDGKTMSAYNAIIGIEKPFETDFVGGVTGKILLGYLDKTGSEEVNLLPKPIGKSDPITGEEYSDLHISAGQSKLKLSLRPLSQQPWQFPQFDESNKITLTKDFLTMLEFCLVSVDKTAVHPEHLGVTVEILDDQLNLYSTDAATLSWAHLSKQYNCKRITIPGEFCQQLLKICVAEDKLYLSPTAAIAVNRTNTKLFGRILEVETPRNFQQIIKMHHSVDNEYIPIPPELGPALDRAELIAYGSNDCVKISLSSNKLSLYLKSDLGELNESIDIENPIEASAYFDPGLIRRALAERTYFFLTTLCMTLTGPDNFVYLISAREV